MRTKITLALVFINIVLALFVYNLKRESATEEKARALRTRVLGADIVGIRELGVSGSNNQTILNIRRNDTATPSVGSPWLITTPIDWPANDFAVERILNELRHLEHETSFLVSDLEKNGQTLADYGLNPPRQHIVLTRETEPGQPPANVTLGIGDETKTGGRLYLLSPDGARIHVVRRGLLDSIPTALNQNLAQLRSDILFNIPAFEARSLSIQTDGPRVRLRRDNNRWTFETPFTARASKTAVELTLSQLNALRARRFFLSKTDTPDTLTQLNTPAFRIMLEGNNRRETLLVGKVYAPPAPKTEAAEYYARLEDRDQVFTVLIPDRFLEALRRAQDSLRDPRIIDVATDTINAITLSAPDKPPLTLRRLETTNSAGTENWQMLTRQPVGNNSGTQPVEPAQIAALLEQIGLLSAVKYESDAPSAAQLEQYGFTRPELTVTLLPPPAATGGLTANAPRQVAVEFAKSSPASEELYARVLNQAFVYKVPPGTLEHFSADPNHYRIRAIPLIRQGAAVTSFTLAQLPTGAPGEQGAADEKIICQRQVDAGETWETALAKESEAVRPLVETLLRQLRDLRAKDFVADNFSDTVDIDGQPRPWAYRLDIGFTLAGSDTPQTAQLYISERAGGPLQYAGIPSAKLIFTLEQPVIDTLWKLTNPEAPALAAPSEKSE